MNKRILSLWIVAIFLISLGAVPVFQEKYVKADGQILAVNIDSSRFPDTVLVHVSIDVPYTLTKSAFEIYENGKKQQITNFEYTGGGSFVAPVDLVFIIDRSGSMGDDINDIKNNAYKLAEDLKSSGVDARFALITFGLNPDDARIDLPFTDDVSKLKQALDSIIISGGIEWSFDGIMEAFKLNFRPTAQKVFIVVTDEDDQSQSKYSVEEVANKIKSEGVFLVLVYNHNYGYRLSQLSQAVGALDMEILEARQRGFGEVLQRITTTIGQQYHIAYSPTNKNMDGSEREVKVVIHLPDGSTLEAMGSYVAPMEKKKRYQRLTPEEKKVAEIIKKIDQWLDVNEKYLINVNVPSLRYLSGYDMVRNPLIPPIPDLIRAKSIAENTVSFLTSINRISELTITKDDAKLLYAYFKKISKNKELGEDIEIIKLSDRKYKITVGKDVFYLSISSPFVRDLTYHVDILGLKFNPGSKIHVNKYMEIYRDIAGSPLTLKVVYKEEVYDVQSIGVPKFTFPLSTLYGQPAIDRGGYKEYHNGKQFNLYLVGSFGFGAGGSLEAQISAKVTKPIPFGFETGVGGALGIEGGLEAEMGMRSFILSPSVSFNEELYARIEIHGREQQIAVGIETLPQNLIDAGSLELMKLALEYQAYQILPDKWWSKKVKEWLEGSILHKSTELSQRIAETTFFYTKTSVPLTDTPSQFLGAAGKIIGLGWGYGKVHYSAYKSKGFSTNFVFTLKNNLIPSSRKHSFIAVSGLNVEKDLFGAEYSVGYGIPRIKIGPIEVPVKLGLYGVLKAQVGVSGFLGLKIVDPPITDNSLPRLHGYYLGSLAIDENKNGLYDVLELNFNITTNTTGTYKIMGVLSSNNVLKATSSFVNMTLSEGSNVITLGIPGQYIYYTNHTGPFDVGLIIQDANGTLVYYNFTLGKTKSYDYRQFEHVIPEFSFKYIPIDLDKDGKYDEIQVNITEINNLTGITLAPMLTSPGWIIYLNSTNLTSTSRYTMYIDGMHVRKLMGNFTFLLHVANMTSGIYLGSYQWNINVDPSKFESTYPTIEDAIPMTVNYEPAVTFTINVPIESNISITTQYGIGDTVYEAYGYFENITPGIHNLTVLLDPSVFVMHNTENATILSATLVSNGLTTDSIVINKEASFFLLPRAKIWNITQTVNATAKILNTTIEVMSYENTNATVAVILSSGNVTLAEFVYPEMNRSVILEIPIVFNLSDIISNLSREGTLTVAMYNQEGELLAMEEVPVDLSGLLPTPIPSAQESTYTNILVLSQLWTKWFFKYYDEFNKLYQNATAIGIDNETLQKALELHNNATELMKRAWHTDNLNDIKAKLWREVKILPKIMDIRKAFLKEKKAVEILREAIEKASRS